VTQIGATHGWLVGAQDGTWTVDTQGTGTAIGDWGLTIASPARTIGWPGMVIGADWTAIGACATQLVVWVDRVNGDGVTRARVKVACPTFIAIPPCEVGYGVMIPVN